MSIIVKLSDKVRKLVGTLRLMARLTVLSYRHGCNLNVVQNNTHTVNNGDVLLFCTLRNEQARIPYFLEHYRALGVNHFIFVDNDSTDGLQSSVADLQDVSVWHTTHSYKESNFGMHWLNYLLRKYGCGKWCVVCDPDEFLVYPHCETRKLNELGEFLDQEGVCSLFSVLIDMYDTNIDSGEYTEGTPPWDTCRFFDRTGYRSKNSNYLKNLYVQGGVRERVFYQDNPESAPALNKIPFVKWSRHFNYVSSMHNLIPRWPNMPYRENDITGCLLHFKFISQIMKKSSEEMHRGEHYDNSSEYKKYHSAVTASTKLYDDDISVEYTGWPQLVKLGLMNPGFWRR